jgi:DNA-binding NarL/FixJ family response regulator
MDTARTELVAAIRAAALGQTVLAPAVAGVPLRRMRTSQPAALSAREVTVLAQAACGD